MAESFFASPECELLDRRVLRPIPLVDGARLSPDLQTPFEHLEAWFRLAGG